MCVSSDLPLSFEHVFWTDAVEQNDSFVSHAIDAFEAEAAGVTTHQAVVSLRSCAGTIFLIFPTSLLASSRFSLLLLTFLLTFHTFFLSDMSRFLFSCIGAAALSPMFDVTMAHSNPPPAARTEEVKAKAETAAAEGVEVAPPTDTGEVRCEVQLKVKGLGGGDDDRCAIGRNWAKLHEVCPKRPKSA